MLKFLFPVLCLVGFVQAETYPISAFDGSTPKMDVLGEQLPQSFYTESVQDAYNSGENYATQFTKRNTAGLNLYITNETENGLSVVINSVHALSGAIKNYLIDLPPGETMDILYDGYPKITILSLGAFSVYTNVGVFQNGAFTTSPVINEPAPIESLGGGCHWQGRHLEIQNLAPSTPGRVVVFGRLDYSTYYGYRLDVYYPFYPKRYHTGLTLTPCGGPDTLGTRSATGRYILWTGIIEQMLVAFGPPPAFLECVNSAPSTSCNVSGTTIPARWTATKTLPR